ncbi:hypothetical protein LINGRAHAP2_LOCUS25866 [Linum grandiflorum]
MVVVKKLLIFLLLPIVMSLLVPHGGFVVTEAARTINQQGERMKGLNEVYSKLGLICKCCDGGRCTSSWNSSCSNLRCSSWRNY